MSFQVLKPDPRKLKVLTEMFPSAQEKKLQEFLGIINYLSKFSPSTTKVCESLRWLTLAMTERTYNACYHRLFDKPKWMIKEDACMKFYEETKPLYLGTDASGEGLRACLLQARDEVLDDNILRLNIERKALGIFCGLEKFHHYCFVSEVSIITDHKSLVEIFKKGCSNIVSDTTMHTTQNSSIKGKSHIQNWTRSIHSK